MKMIQKEKENFHKREREQETRFFIVSKTPPSILPNAGILGASHRTNNYNNTNLLSPVAILEKCPNLLITVFTQYLLGWGHFSRGTQFLLWGGGSKPPSSTPSLFFFSFHALLIF